MEDREREREREKGERSARAQRKLEERPCQRQMHTDTSVYDHDTDFRDRSFPSASSFRSVIRTGHISHKSTKVVVFPPAQTLESEIVIRFAVIVIIPISRHCQILSFTILRLNWIGWMEKIFLKNFARKSSVEINTSLSLSLSLFPFFLSS